MQASEFLPKFASSFEAKRVFAEPHKQDGITVIPAAAIGGGGGMGQGASDKEGGAGMGLHARPVGAYVIRNGEVVWKPAFDLNRAIWRGQIVVFTGLLLYALFGRRRYRDLAHALERHLER